MRFDGSSKKDGSNAGDNVKFDNNSEPRVERIEDALPVHKNLLKQMKHYLASLEREYLLLPRRL